jgi:hypothetical protein
VIYHCTTQAELDDALYKRTSSDEVWCEGHERFVARGSSHVMARESSHVVAWESSHVVARGSSHVVAWGSSHVVARESSHVEASRFVSVSIQRSHSGEVAGGVQIRPKIETAQDWCDNYGVEVVDGVVVLFKAVSDAYESSRGFLYVPGTIPVAPDWDGGVEECGGGLHFCAHPALALDFNPDAKRFIANPVRLSDLRDPKITDHYQNKIKGHRCCAEVWEVDRDGKRIES